VFSWGAQLEDARKETAELEQRISALRAELRTVQGPIAAATVQRILALREKQLERTKLHAQFIEEEIAQGSRQGNGRSSPGAGDACLLWLRGIVGSREMVAKVKSKTVALDPATRSLTEKNQRELFPSGNSLPRTSRKRRVVLYFTACHRRRCMTLSLSVCPLKT
jgi:hypothetical protein